MTSELDILANLLAHEANEREARSKSPELPADMRKAYEHQKRGVFQALDMVNALRAGKCPGMCGVSLGAVYLHIHGELLPVGSPECFPTVAPVVHLDDGSRMKFCAVHQLEADELGVVRLRGKPFAAVVGENDDSLHGSSCG